jgi:hypothetical protein
MVEVSLIFSHHTIEVPFAQDQEVVQAFSAHTTNSHLDNR